MTAAASVGSLFSGIGGIDAGLERAGFEVAWQVEIDCDCVKILERHWTDAPRFGDVCEVGAHNLTPVDAIAFGSPCQDVSVAGRRAGMKGERSGLFYEAARIIGELRPALVLFENVPGLLSSNAGRDFAAILGTFRELGARDICWRTLDAQHFGVPQRRRRIFLVADFGGERAAEILFEPSSCYGDSAESGKAGAGVAASPSSGAGVAGPLKQSSGRRGWGLGAEEAAGGSLIAHPLTASAGKTSDHAGKHGAGPVNLIPVGALSANGVGTCGADDNQAQAGHLVSGPLTRPTGKGINTTADDGALITHPLTSEGADAPEDGTGRGMPIIPILEVGARQGTRDSARNGSGIGYDGDPMFSLQAGKRHGIALPFDTTQVTSEKNYSQPREGDTDHPLAAGAHPPAVAFAWQQGDDSKHGKDGRGRSWVARAGDYAAGLSRSRHDAIAGPSYGVRRLTPMECERLQGFEDGFTDILSDSARYRCLGNSVAVPCVEWIGKRMYARLVQTDGIAEAAS